MSIAEWMTHDPLTANRNTELQEALARMIRHRVKHLPIVEGQQFFGLLSGPSLLQKVLVEHSVSLEEAGARKAEEFCSDVPRLGPDFTVEQALELLHGHSCLPVLENDKLVGLFTQQNVLSYLMRSIAPNRFRRGSTTPTAHRLDAVVGLLRKVSTASDLDGMLNTIVEHLKHLMPLDQAFILLRPPGDSNMTVGASYLGSDPETKGIELMPVQDTLSGYVVVHRKSLRIDDLREEKRFPHSAQLNKSFEGPELKSVAAVPLMDQSSAIGVFHIWSTKGFAYVDSDVELLELVAGYVAFLIQRSWQLEKERQLVQELQKANRIKDEFLAVVTHDLRNTIQGILSYSQILHRKVTDEKLGRFAKGIVDSAQHMGDLTSDLHDLARLGMQAIRISPKVTPVAPIIALVLDEMSDFARQEQVTVEPVSVSPDLACMADPVRLRQVISNLVSNAIKYNRPGGWVRLGCKQVGDDLVIEVRDSGIGIAENEQSSVFNLFHRASNARRLDGSGLGLSITRQLVELHGGQLELESEVGVGSCFRVKLPARQTAAV